MSHENKVKLPPFLEDELCSQQYFFISQMKITGRLIDKANDSFGVFQQTPK